MPKTKNSVYVNSYSAVESKQSDTILLAKVRDPKAREELPSLVQTYLDLRDEEKPIKKAKEDVLKIISSIVDGSIGLGHSSNVKNIDGGTWKLSCRTRDTKYIDRQELLRLGVDMDTIDAATKVKSSAFYVPSRIGEREED